MGTATDPTMFPETSVGWTRCLYAKIHDAIKKPEKRERHLNQRNTLDQWPAAPRSTRWRPGGTSPLSTNDTEIIPEAPHMESLPVSSTAQPTSAVAAVLRSRGSYRSYPALHKTRAQKAGPRFSCRRKNNCQRFCRQTKSCEEGNAWRHTGELCQQQKEL